MRILYRADGGHPIGTGHLYRAARVLRALASTGDLDARLMAAADPSVGRIVGDLPARRVTLPPRPSSDAVKPRLEAAPLLAELAREPADLLVVDMLDTPPDAMAALAATGTPIATFDDRGEGRRYASLLINVLVEEPDPAGLPAHTHLLEGGLYVVLDPVFAAAHASLASRPARPLRRVFVSMGGADAAGLTVKVARALRRVDALERVEFASGPAFPHRAELDAVLHDAPWESVVHVGLPGLLDRYGWSDLCLVAGGLTMYEVCCVGVPAIAVCQPIDHQYELAARLEAAGAMVSVGDGLAASEEAIADAVRRLCVDGSARERMAAAGPRIVDGRGVERVAAALRAVMRF